MLNECKAQHGVQDASSRFAVKKSCVTSVRVDQWNCVSTLLPKHLPGSSPLHSHMNTCSWRMMFQSCRPVLGLDVFTPSIPHPSRIPTVFCIITFVLLSTFMFQGNFISLSSYTLESPWHGVHVFSHSLSFCCFSSDFGRATRFSTLWFGVCLTLPKTMCLKITYVQTRSKPFFPFFFLHDLLPEVFRGWWVL